MVTTSGTGAMVWDAIVLAGGRGSRLGGVDKAALEVGGESLLSRTLHAVAGAQRVVVVGEVDVPGVVVVQEQPRFAGPAAAIGAGLAHVEAPFVVVVSCDQPFLSEAIGAVLDAAGSGDGAVAVDENGRRQHLLSVLRSDSLRAAAHALPTLTNVSVRALMVPLDLTEVVLTGRATLDVDTWHDREQAEEGARDD